jgi:enoyl-CoA hydratase/carnithine racemase
VTARLSALFNQIEASTLPVIAAVNGITLSGGLELMLVSDLVVAAESARIGDGHSNTEWGSMRRRDGERQPGSADRWRLS